MKKTVTTVAGDGFSGSVRERRRRARRDMAPVALNVDASPSILPNGKIRLNVNVQYAAGQNSLASDGRPRTDIRQGLVLILESGKTLKVSEATDPCQRSARDREVKATILR